MRTPHTPPPTHARPWQPWQSSRGRDARVQRAQAVPSHRGHACPWASTVRACCRVLSARVPRGSFGVMELVSHITWACMHGAWQVRRKGLHVRSSCACRCQPRVQGSTKKLRRKLAPPHLPPACDAPGRAGGRHAAAGAARLCSPQWGLSSCLCVTSASSQCALRARARGRAQRGGGSARRRARRHAAAAHLPPRLCHPRQPWRWQRFWAGLGRRASRLHSDG